MTIRFQSAILFPEMIFEKSFDWLPGAILETPINQLKLNTMRILVIEDSPQNIQAAKDQLQMDHELTICTTPEEAMEKLEFRNAQENTINWERQLPYDVLLTSRYIGSPVDYGAVFALFALNFTTIPKVGIVTSEKDNRHLLYTLSVASLIPALSVSRWKGQKNLLITSSSPDDPKDWKQVLDKW